MNTYDDQYVQCTHPRNERFERQGHGYLGDYTGTHVLCGGCGTDLTEQAPAEQVPA
jgi:hypothetical protein